MQNRLAQARSAELQRAKHPFDRQAGSRAAGLVSSVLPPTNTNAAVEHPAGKDAQVKKIYRRQFGTRSELMTQSKEFGASLARVVSEAGIPAGFDARSRILSLWHLSLRIRMMWPADEFCWRIERTRAVHQAPYVLIVRMAAAYSPLDYLLMTDRLCAKHLPRSLAKEVSKTLKPYHIESPERLMSRLAQLSAAVTRSTDG